ncbi:PREDICTED: skin secretory protein xP2-like [Sturnus vulgaris]|uniref:skin secretory protein xP2-like n=1 Tax=Sturnus vulgaris TaxID=9172 RepID=UPI000719ED2D|nr:PREDICTED: skin secretory protein xP2-like [Sturnus vulgaris]
MPLALAPSLTSAEREASGGVATGRIIRRAHRNRGRGSPVPTEGGQQAGPPPPCSPPAPRGRLRRRLRGQRPPRRARRPAPPAAARCSTVAGGARLHQPPRGGCSAAPPRHMPVENYRQPPRPVTEPGRSGARRPPRVRWQWSRSVRRAPALPRHRAARATDAGPPRIPLSRSSAPDTILTAGRSRATTAAGRAGHPVPAEVRAPYRAHADARPLPPRRVGLRGRRSAAPSPVSVSVSVSVSVPVLTRPGAAAAAGAAELMKVWRSVGAGTASRPRRRAPPPASSRSPAPRLGTRTAPAPRLAAPGAPRRARAHVGLQAHGLRVAHTHARGHTSTHGTHGHAARMGMHGHTLHLAHLGMNVPGIPHAAHRYVDVEGHMQACTGMWHM